MDGVERPWWWSRVEPRRAYWFSAWYALGAVVFLTQAWAQGSEWAGAMSALFVVAAITTLVRGVATQRVLEWERREF